MKIIILSILVIISAAFIAGSQEADRTIYDFQAVSIDGKNVPLSVYKDKVVLIVNVASKCGFTPHYAGIQELYSKYKDQGFVVLGFPCNQFGGQEPGTNEEIKNFCSTEYGVTFPMFSKIDVNGENAHPLFVYLTTEKDGVELSPVKWNFEKFLIGRDGKLIKRFRTKTEPASIAPYIEEALKR